MTCSECGVRAKRLPLNERTSKCEHCGFSAVRDRNAAAVILATGERIRTGVDDVRHLLPPLGDVVGGPSQKSPGFSRGEPLSHNRFGPRVGR